jgi:cell pole-organizing protein PopZ
MNAEPSMEEILASIRKIIAEEPPGSRATPSAGRAGTTSPAPAPQRGFMSREAFMRSSAPPEPEDDEPSSSAPKSGPSSIEAKSMAEPSLAATSREPEPPENSALSKNSNGHDKSAVERSLNSTDESGPGRDANRVEESKAASALEPETKSIEAQLADLLGDELQALNGKQHGEADAGIKTNVEGGSASVTVEEPAVPEPRPGFTVSRIGFTNGSAETSDSVDPFSFDLGPSPFSSHAPEDFERQNSVSPDASSKRPLRLENRHSESNGSSAPAMPDSTSSMSASAPAARPSEPFAVPSVAATLGPHRTLEPLSAAFKPAPSEHRSIENHSYEDRSFEDRSFEHRSSTPAPERENARNTSVRAEFRGERLERMLQAAPVQEGPPDRVMEDAVADLLRPLLRTWLAENMPKIVERALRREMTDRLLPGQKGPFD